MGALSRVHHLHAVKAFEKAGFRVAPQGKHIIVTNGERTLTIPRHNPINAFTMGTIVKGSGLSMDEFRKLL